jgi:hypothetical protein
VATASWQGRVLPPPAAAVVCVPNSLLGVPAACNKSNLQREPFHGAWLHGAANYKEGIHSEGAGGSGAGLRDTALVPCGAADREITFLTGIPIGGLNVSPLGFASTEIGDGSCGRMSLLKTL